MDAVSLTVTPSSLVNSLENGGLRVDGMDEARQPIPAGEIGATSGHIKWRATPRHSAADSDEFGYLTPYMAYFLLDGTHYILVHYNLGGQVRLNFNDGGGVHTGDWNPATLNVDTEYQLEIKYNAAQMEFIVDGVTQITIVTPIDFGVGIPTFAYWGSSNGGNFSADSVISAP